MCDSSQTTSPFCALHTSHSKPGQAVWGSDPRPTVCTGTLQKPMRRAPRMHPFPFATVLAPQFIVTGAYQTVPVGYAGAPWYARHEGMSGRVGTED